MESFFEFLSESVKAAKEKVDSIRTESSFVFPIFTDLHTMSAEHEFSEKLYKSLEMICNSIKVNGVINLGDTFNMLGRMIQIPNESLSEEFEKLFTKIYSIIGCPLINVNGNHDGIGTDFFKPDYWNDIAKLKYGNTSAVYSDNGSYYYLDLGSKARFVVLSLPHESDLKAENPTPIWSFGEKQLEWLENIALNTDRDVVILSHVPFYGNKYLGNTETMLEVWNGEEKRMSYVSALCGWIDDIDEAVRIVEDFDKKGNLIACLSGHTHTDSFWAPGESDGRRTNPLPCIQVCTASTFINVKLCIDIAVWTPEQNKFDLVRVGNGEDRNIK